VCVVFDARLQRNNSTFFNNERFNFTPVEGGYLLSYIGVLSLIARGVVIPTLTRRVTGVFVLCCLSHAL
jgi:hypothetical protein